MKLAFLASHGGSAARHLVGACQRGELDATPVALVSNNSRSPALAWAREAGLAVAHLSSAKYPDPDDLDAAILGVLVGAGADTLVLSGYMREIGPRVLAHFAGRLVNIHPSLLPRHGGRGMYGDRLGANLHAITASASAVRNLVTCIERCHLEVEGFVVSS